MIGLLAIGCGGPATKAPPKTAEKEQPIFAHQLNVIASGGEATTRAPTVGREQIYHIKWANAQVAVADKGISTGTMDDVTGEMFKDDKVASTFKADHATADRDKQLLILTGHVQAFSVTEHATISCDKLEWHAAEKIVKAFGHVELRSPSAILSGLDEVWATADLKYFATPAMFKRPPDLTPKKP